MRNPADDASREETLESGGLRVSEQVLRQRLAIVADLAHAHALAAVEAAAERDELRWQIEQDVELKELRVQFAAVTAELDRLRSIPELRVGQRLRQVSGSVRRSDTGTGTEADTGARTRTGTEVGDSSTTDPTDASDLPDPSIEGSTGLVHPDLAVPSVVITVRNRAEVAANVIAQLQALGVTNVSVVDNASSDPAVAGMFARLECSVTRLDANMGRDGPWVSGVMARLLAAGNVLEVSGHVTPGPDCPADVVDRMTDELRRRPDVDAVALSQGSDEAPAVGGFRLLRKGLRSRPDRVATLDAPYVATVDPSDPSDPAERFAQLHDDIDATGARAANDA